MPDNKHALHCLSELSEDAKILAKLIERAHGGLEQGDPVANVLHTLEVAERGPFAFFVQHLREAVKPHAWEHPLPWTVSALQRQGMTVEQFRAAIQRVIDAYGAP